jgi:outer membrane receptor protein involved in Fe transport
LRPGPDPNHPGAKDDAATYKAEISYRAREGLFFYALASEGFRPSGYNGNAVPGFSVIPAQFKPDSLWNYEVGAKTRWLGGRLTVDGAVYRIDWRNIQVLSSAPTPVGLGVQPFTTNGSTAQIYGAELEVAARLTRDFTANLSLNHFFKAELTADAPTGPNGLTPRAGDPLPYDPPWSFSVGGEYRHPLGPHLDGFLRVDWSYVGPRTTGLRARLDNGLPNNGFNSFSEYHLVDLRVGVSSGRWRAMAFVENLFDARPAITQQNFAPAPVTIRTTRKPRTVGLSLRRAF